MNVTNSSQISNIGKFLDQPLLEKKLNKAMPAVLIGSGLLVGGYDVYKSCDKEKKNSIIKNACTLTGVIASSLIAVKGLKVNGKQIIKGLAHKHSHGKTGKELIQDFLPTVKDEKIKPILEKGKNKILSLKEITDLRNYTNKSNEGKKFFEKLIPKTEDMDSKHIFKEMKRLSLIGLIPVVGGVAGGTLGDKLTDKNWKKKTPNKIKEGFYQYFANIFLCNVGAGLALYSVEKMEAKNVIKKSKATRALAMIGGVLTVGILGGSAIANYLGQKVVNPMFNKKKDGGIYHERTPDPLDVSLHVDDLAAVGVFSGLNWIEPALPTLYSVSGYRAGIGYRNNGHHKHDHLQHYKEYQPGHQSKHLNFKHNHTNNNKIFSKFINTQGGK